MYECNKPYGICKLIINMQTPLKHKVVRENHFRTNLYIVLGMAWAKLDPLCHRKAPKFIFRTSSSILFG